MSRPLRPGDPRFLGGHEILSRLGEGGMGSVFLGRDAAGRHTAIKVIRAEYASDEEFRGRFRSEVARARQVPPFCTAAVLDADPEHETPYLVVEYVDGPSLTRVVEENGPLTGGNLHSVAVGVATAIAAIHGAGVIHRDLKPSNVLFSLGNPKVIDFGIARAVEVTSKHTRTDQMVGTVQYMAPERFESDSSATGPAADVFAWGAVVGFAGTGRTPFAGDTPAVTAARILTQPPQLDGLPEPLKSLVARTLAKDPRERPTAHELLEMLLSGEQQAVAMRERPELRQAAEAARRLRPPAGSRPRRRTLALAAAGAVLAVLGAGTAVYAFSGPDNPAAPATDPFSLAPPASRYVRGLTVIDPLERGGQWSDDSDLGGDHCGFTDGGLVAHLEQAGNTDVECTGPDAEFTGDSTIAVDAELLTSGSCARIAFRENGPAAYVLRLCEGALSISLDNSGSSTPLGAAAVSAPVGTGHRIRLELRGEAAIAFLDDKGTLRAGITDRSLLAGQVTLGVTAEKGTGEVRYTDAEIRSL